MPLSLVRRPKSPNWILRGTVRGIRVEESTGIGDRKIAEEIRAKRESEIIEQSIHGRRATRDLRRSRVKLSGERRQPALPRAGHQAFRRHAARSYRPRCHRQGRPQALPGGDRCHPYPAVLHAGVSAVIAHAARRGWCSPLLIERPAVSLPPFHWLTPDEAERLIEAASVHLKPLLIFLFFTGARSGEALGLDWRSVDLTRAHVTFTETKNGEMRGVPLHARVVAVLRLGEGDVSASEMEERRDARRAATCPRRRRARQPVTSRGRGVPAHRRVALWVAERR